MEIIVVQIQDALNDGKILTGSPNENERRYKFHTRFL